MSPEPLLEIPPGYERWIRYGANWTMLISPYLILYFVLFFAIGGESIGSTDMGSTLELAGKSPSCLARPSCSTACFMSCSLPLS